MLQKLRTIISAMTLGALAMMLILAALRVGRGGDAHAELPYLSIFAAIVAVWGGIVRFGLTPVFAKMQRNMLLEHARAVLQADEAREHAPDQPPGVEELVSPHELWRMCLGQIMIPAAVIEGASALASIAYFVEGQHWVLVLNLILVLGLGLHFPSYPRLAGWGEAELAELDQLR